MARFGDQQWAAATGGQVLGVDRLAQLGAALRFQLSRRLRARPRMLGLASAREVESLLKEIDLPRGPLVARASELVTTLGPPALTGHVLRTWAWGVVLAARNGQSLDRETFALAALLHDLALARRSAAACCFAAEGATQAKALLLEWGASPGVQGAVSEAICLHLRVAVPVSFGIEAHLVHAGAAIDLLGGPRLAEIPSEVRRDVLTRHPRGPAKAFFAESMRREHRHHPTSRMGRWVSMGFLDRIARGPFEDTP